MLLPQYLTSLEPSNFHNFVMIFRRWDGLWSQPLEHGLQVIDTLKVAAEVGPESVSAYVISMATHASDVLAVELLKREAWLMVSNCLRVSAVQGRVLPSYTDAQCQSIEGWGNPTVWEFVESRRLRERVCAQI